MSPKTKYFFNQNNIYVSLGILIIVIAATWMIAQTLSKVEQIYPVVSQVQALQLQVNTLQVQQNNTQHDVGMIKEKLQMYDIEIQK